LVSVVVSLSNVQRILPDPSASPRTVCTITPVARSSADFAIVDPRLRGWRNGGGICKELGGRRQLRGGSGSRAANSAGDTSLVQVGARRTLSLIAPVSKRRRRPTLPGPSGLGRAATARSRPGHSTLFARWLPCALIHDSFHGLTPANKNSIRSAMFAGRI